MIGTFVIDGRQVRVDFGRGVCLAIELDFAGPQPCHFGAQAATATPMTSGGFLGDTRRGGSCNVPIMTLNPHCNGTHTESVAHIVDQPVPIHAALPARPIPATLISLTPESSLRIIAADVKAALEGRADAWLEAVVIRTRPNGVEKRTRHYGIDAIPASLAVDAIDYLVGRGCAHLLVDVPSIDEMHDEGRLTGHHRFWRVPEGSHTLAADSRRDASITEMIYAPDALGDGSYFLAIQIPAFSTDVAPSRPWLYPVEMG